VQRESEPNRTVAGIVRCRHALDGAALSVGKLPGHTLLQNMLNIASVALYGHVRVGYFKSFMQMSQL
jgi:hypothetical protein